jgi:hypothetical protein
MDETRGEQAPQRGPRWRDLVPDVEALARDAESAGEARPLSESELALVLEGRSRCP